MILGNPDRRAFEQFVGRSSDRLVRTAYLLVGDRQHAEDVVQTALLRTARRWRSAEGNPEAYARKVVVNLVKDRWRDLSRQPSEVGVFVPDVPGTSPMDVLLDRDELVRAARTLPDGQRAVLVLRFFDDLSVDDTAALLGISPGTVKSQTSRALSGLRAALTPQNTDSKEMDHAHR